MKNIMKELGQFVLMVAAVFVVSTVITTYIAQPLVVDGGSMENNLEDGERLWMLKLADIERFDVVVFPSPENEENLLIKRVIGVPGDTIAYEDDQLIINGQAVTEPYLESKASETPGDFTYDFTLEEVTGEAVVPEGAYFVLGDNRMTSVDGRRFGLIDSESVEGEADFVYWPLTEMRLLDKWELNETGDAIVPR